MREKDNTRKEVQVKTVPSKNFRRIEPEPATNLFLFATVLEEVKLAAADCLNSITKLCILAQSKM